jgi:hypothetical protein
MEGFAFFGILISIAFYILLFWVIIRAVRAIERVADNLWAISRAHTHSVEAIERIAGKMERIADNESTRE